MNKDSKKRKIQQRYKDEVGFKKTDGKNGLEVVLVIFSFIFLLYLGTKFALLENDGIQPIEANDVEGNWMGVTIEIDEALKKKDGEYTGIAIDFNPEPIKIIIKTSLKESSLTGDEKLDKYISVANKSIVSNNLPSTLQANDTYEIIVISKNKEEIARKEFYK